MQQGAAIRLLTHNNYIAVLASIELAGLHLSDCSKFERIPLRDRCAHWEMLKSDLISLKIGYKPKEITVLIGDMYDVTHHDTAMC